MSADNNAKSQESDHPGLQEELEQARQRLLDLERELQFIKLEQEENKALLSAARHDLNLNSKQAEERQEKEVRTRFKMLFQDLSGPVAQLLAQDYMLNVQSKSLNAKDVQAISNRLIQSLKNHGLEIAEPVGSIVRFDATMHEPLTLEDTFKQDDEAIVRLSGICFDGKVLRRAAVSKQSNSD